MDLPGGNPGGDGTTRSEPAGAPAGVHEPAAAGEPAGEPPAPVSGAGDPATRSGSWLAGLDPRGWRTTIVAGALMFGVVFGVNLVNAAVPLPDDPALVDPGDALPVGPTSAPGQPTSPPVAPGPVEPGAGVAIGSGVVAYPPAGWTVVGSEPGQVVLQKGGAVMIIGALPWTDLPLELATAYRDAFFATGELTANEPETGEMGDGIPAVGFGYTGILEGTSVDGAMFVGAATGTGVVVNVFGASGSLRGVGDDVDEILATIQLTGGPS